MPNLRAPRIFGSLALAAALSASGCDGGAVDDQGVAPTDGGPADEAAPIGDLAATCVPGLPDAAVALDPNCPIVKPASPDTFDQALKLAGLDRCSLGFTEQDWKEYPSILREDAFRLPWYDAVHDHAVRAPSWGRGLVGALDQAAATPTPVTRALIAAGGALGLSDAPCVSPGAVDPAQPLARAVAKAITDAGGKPNLAALEADAADVPMPLQLAVAQVVLAASAANQAYLALEKPLSDNDKDTLSRTSAFIMPGEMAANLTDKTAKDLLANRFDEQALLDGATRLAYSIETAGLARFAGMTGFSFDQATPLGRVVIHDGKNDTYKDDPAHPILLLVDAGGDDTYQFPAGAVDASLDLTSKRHVSIAIDLAGRDTYGYEEMPDSFDGKRLPSDADGRYHPAGCKNADTCHARGTDDGPISLSETPRQGAARMGYGMLFDLGADDDRYTSLRMSQGFGSSGVGVLFDAGGNDTYAGEAGVQGAASFGLGLLLDMGGDDTYRTYAFAQGFGYSRGVGVLYDVAGQDTYYSDSGDISAGGDPLYLTPQLPCDAKDGNGNYTNANCGNSSFTQGAGFGRRAPGQFDQTGKCIGDCAFMSGGVGVLRDLAGDDKYTTSVFGQGTGYWFGTGLLADGAGNDTYDGKWYVQGSSAHFALALFFDDAGDDKYNPTLVPSATSIGVGHDFSVSWHIDGGGNDVYRAPGLSLGSGNVNGIGVLINLGGNDEYHAAGEPTLGCGNLSGEVYCYQGERARPTTGIFVHVGGKSVYDVPGSPVQRGAEMTWIDDEAVPNHCEQTDAGTVVPNYDAGFAPIATEHGAGIDTPTGSVSLP